MADWIEQFRQLWEQRYTQLDDLLLQLKNKTNANDNPSSDANC